MTNTVYVLNGPNLNLLGTREPDKYGSASLADVERLCRERAARHGLDVVFRQTNGEGQLLDWIHEARQKRALAIVLNAAGYTHTSVALLDALVASEVPVFEVHITNVHAREAFRHRSFVSPAARGVLCGFGIEGYGLAIDGVAALLLKSPRARTATKTRAARKRS
jgi:3-dehydroquinate dehydratase II